MARQRRINKMRARRIIDIGIIGLLLLSISGIAFAKSEETEEKIIKRTSNEVIGEVGAIGKNSISIIYGRDEKKSVEYEMLIPIDVNTRLEHKKSLSELKVGDKIKIQFEDATSEDAGREKLERMAKVISFVSPAIKKPELPEPWNE